MSHHDDWPEQNPPVRMRYRVLLFGGMLAAALLVIVTSR